MGKIMKGNQKELSDELYKTICLKQESNSLLQWIKFVNELTINKDKE